MKPKTTSELMEAWEDRVHGGHYVDELYPFSPQSKVADDIENWWLEKLHQREQQIYAELMEKVEPPKEWRHCLKVAFGQEETCALCGFCPEKLKTIINNIFKHAE